MKQMVAMSSGGPSPRAALDTQSAGATDDGFRPGQGPSSKYEAETHADPVVQLKDVAYSYENGLSVLGGVTFEVGRGEILSIAGPSGCGKSTMLRVLSGLRAPTGGAVDWHLRGGGRHPCAMVFQEDTLLPWLKVRDNVGLFGKLHGQRDPHRVAELLSMVKLEQFSDYYPNRLSGGMKRRVAVLKALYANPEVLLMDEPFSALDEPTRIAIHQDVYDLLRELEMSAVLVTHDLAEAISLSDRVLLLSHAPSHVRSEFKVPFSQQRNMMELRADPAFLSLYGRVWNELSEEITSASA